MATSSRPLTVRLPFSLAERWCLKRVLAGDPTRSWADTWPLVPCFELSGPEKQFARCLLRRKRNVWLFRCNQKAFCGDFIAVDMSAAEPRLRLATVIELKSGAELRFGGAGAGNQLQRAAQALAELAEKCGVIVEQSPFALACGDGEAVLRWFGTRRIA